MKANLLPVLASIQREILSGIHLSRFRVAAKGNKGTILFFIDFHVCDNLVAIPRLCPCDMAMDDNCYKTPLSCKGIQVRIPPLLATVMDLYERQLFQSQTENVLIVSGNYNLGEAEDKPSRKALLYFHCFLHSHYCKTYSCIRLDRNSFLLQKHGCTLLWSNISEIFSRYCSRIKELDTILRSTRVFVDF